MTEKNGDEEIIHHVVKRSKLMEWFEKNCLWARRVNPDDMEKLSRNGIWEVLVITGPKTVTTVSSETFLTAVEAAYEMSEGDEKKQ